MSAETIRPHEMPLALQRAGEGVKVLSLDCFDTLLWRDCYEPSDVFAALPDLSVAQRLVAEKHARKAELALRKRNEVSIEAIYAQGLPNAGRVTREDAVAAELQAEMDSCFAFAPTVELMKEAKARGLTTIIVSDTYLSARQLRSLIEQAAGEEVAGLIDKIFVSSEAGISKSEGLLAKALQAIKAKPTDVLHIGDNKVADYEASRALGVPALHLLQFSETAKQRLRFERSCQQMIGDAGAGVRALMPHRATLANEEPQVSESAQRLGLTVLGPVFYAFDQWLRAEAKALQKERGGRVHWLFMLRDGHLPHAVHEIAGEEQSTARVEISRFVATSAALTSSDAYTRKFALELGLKPSTLARQMLFTEDEIASLVGPDDNQQEMIEGSFKLLAELRKGKREKIIRKRARERAERLIAHVRSRVNPQKGDTLMLVDLGYNGTAQSQIDALLSESFDCHVAGRYLLLRELTAAGLDKKGLLDERHFDGELLDALCGNVSVIEQLATCEMGSVVDFTPEGEPIREEPSVKGAQSEVRTRVQEGALQYVRAASEGCTIRQRSEHEARGFRECASGVLTRFMFLPHADELAILKSFEHDINMGSERKVPLFDAGHAHEGLRRRGLFYMVGSERMFLPAEIEGEDFHTRLSHFAQKRFGLGLTYHDTSAAGFTLPAFFMSAADSAQGMIEARSTHEGYYSVRVPVPDGVQSIGLQVGSVFEWFELASISMASVGALKGGRENDKQIEELGVQYDGVKLHAPGIHECTGAAAFVLVNIPQGQDEDDPKMIEVVIRPLISRKAVTAAAPVPSPHKEQAA
ncbi:HAD family hydrolase [Erythrobacter sp. SCSIO 43205]|uniref:HAD family hydrolase n=1 Tax=Erythrobacter sp. SCSIO 43205 TaxID=2779361 RepID=UPI001CA91AA4|nr:HAD family hydrolase [Erythrobacter sp. SCSIO 43205]UAB78734.1 HAD family hydrolase [Erythrobacter sp. SCSIO 43205]